MPEFECDRRCTNLHKPRAFTHVSLVGGDAPNNFTVVVIRCATFSNISMSTSAPHPKNCLDSLMFRRSVAVTSANKDFARSCSGFDNARLRSPTSISKRSPNLITPDFDLETKPEICGIVNPLEQHVVLASVCPALQAACSLEPTCYINQRLPPIPILFYPRQGEANKEQRKHQAPTINYNVWRTRCAAPPDIVVYRGCLVFVGAP